MGYLTKFLLALYLISLTLPHVSLLAAKTGQGQLRFLDGHNAERAEVGVPPLTWNSSLAAYARKWANTRIETCEMEHSNGPYGECIAEGYGNLKASDAVRMWAGEKKYYDHASNKCADGQSCGHYTQVVWRDTKYLGCARVKCKNSWMFVICSYDPPGNYEGESPY